jgi:hypothetical protein
MLMKWLIFLSFLVFQNHAHAICKQGGLLSVEGKLKVQRSEKAQLECKWNEHYKSEDMGRITLHGCVLTVLPVSKTNLKKVNYKLLEVYSDAQFCDSPIGSVIEGKVDGSCCDTVPIEFSCRAGPPLGLVGDFITKEDFACLLGKWVLDKKK